MGKIKPRTLQDSAKDTPKKSLKTIVKPKEKLNLTPVVQSKKEVHGLIDFPKRTALPALKRKQKAKKISKSFEKKDNGATGPSTTPVHQKKHVKLAEKKKKLALKFEMMLEEQKKARKLQKVEKANKKIGSVATMGAIKDALPSLDGLLKFKNGDIKTGIPNYESIKVKGKKSGKKTNKDRKETKTAIKDKRIAKESQEQTKRYDYLQKLMNDAVFRKNPRQVIADHIKNTKLLEQE